MKSITLQIVSFNQWAFFLENWSFIWVLRRMLMKNYWIRQIFLLKSYFFKTNQTVKSLYTSADIKIYFTYLLNQWMDFGNLRDILEYFFKGNPTVRSLYTSADIKIDFTVSFEPVDGFWQFKSHFGVLFQGQFNSEVTVHFSWYGKRHLHHFWSSGLILEIYESFCGIF